ncbi:MAG: hypothetical protein ABH867_01720 [Patescibacteria group bacterium]|nr:hypothetical protein [Patescibacteria group bacterium]
MKLLVITVLGLSVWFGYRFFKKWGAEQIPKITKLEESRKQSGGLVLKGLLKSDDDNHYSLVAENGTSSLQSRSIDLSEYIDQEVEVAGVFSGAIFYVDQIQKE